MPSFRFASATGSGSSLIVTCSDQFAGKTITCTNGTKTYTRTCPSTSPYEVVFKGITPGTWTVSGVVEGRTYSQQVVITDFDVTLTAGFDYKQWVTLGGLDPTDYTDLEDVFADEAAVRRLMTIHASADYLIEKVTDDIDTIDDFTANDTAMKWIGLRDYVCDGLTAITGVEAKFLTSEYWERYLKDHVPVMTSNTAPYGTASAYQVFDGSTSTTASGTDFSYKFTNPICVKKFECNVNDGTLQGSNDGSTWTTISTPESNTTYYLYYRVHFTSSKTPHTIQFYGRSLNVSVPVMTSNTAPYGEVSAGSVQSGYDAYKAFNDDAITVQGWTSTATTNAWIAYDFGKKVNIKMINIAPFCQSNAGGLRAKDFILQGYDGNDWVDIYESTIPNASQVTNNYYSFANSTEYSKYRLYVKNNYSTNGGYIIINELQFYGLDYSEREFAEGSTMKYLYDHGVEFEPFSYKDASNDGDKIIIGTNDAYAMSAQNNLANYSILKAVIGDNNGNEGGYIIIDDTNTPAYSYTTWTAYTKLMNGNNPNNVNLSAASINQSLYCGLITNKALQCKELWLE